MARPLRISYPNALYHVTCRGNSGRDIYRDDRDRASFLEKLESALEIYRVRLHAYVLMRNHFHLIVETPRANLSEFMRQFSIAYTGAYNHRHRRAGHLYQGRFKAILVEADGYLLELSRYLHLNPVRVRPGKELGFRKKRSYLEKYPWSSLGGYLSARKKKAWVDYRRVLGYVGGSRGRYGRFVDEGLRQGYSTPWEELKGQAILGQDGFLAGVKRKWLQRSARFRERPSLRLLRAGDAEALLKKVARHFRIGLKELRRRRTPYRDERALGMELLYRHCGLSQMEIGQRLGRLDYTSVSRERKRFRETLGLEPKWRRRMRTIEKDIS